ncbi:Hypothetical predicted protein [Pelobates cultripes]|uniref:Uncharacterized protein n=1 Tax=Pelobates cultripes TaxID=61616 RepID=A0AAD1RM83_PELCU|nr:Hypothetical predicted protein [Pelobates cultripes]
MADASCLPEPIDPELGVLHKLEAIFANFWCKLEARTQPLISTQASSLPAKTLPPTRKKAQQGIIAGQSSLTRQAKLQRPQRKRVKTDRRYHNRLRAQRRVKTRQTHSSCPTTPRYRSLQNPAPRRTRAREANRSPHLTQKPTPPHRDTEKQDTQESSQGLHLAPRGDRISTGSGIGYAEHSSLQQDFFTHPAHQLNLKYQSLS